MNVVWSAGLSTAADDTHLEQMYVRSLLYLVCFCIRPCWSTVTPGSPISPLRLASDVVGLSLTFVEGIVRESGSLRNELDTQVAMTYAEYANFLRFQAK